jgi:hypothetical protein
VEPILFVMAIMGCGESDAPCREVRLEAQGYRSQAACLAATEGALMRNDDLSFPTIVARCRRADARPGLLRGSEVVLPGPNATRPPTRFASAARR